MTSHDTRDPAAELAYMDQHMDEYGDLPADDVAALLAFAHAVLALKYRSEEDVPDTRLGYNLALAAIRDAAARHLGGQHG